MIQFPRTIVPHRLLLITLAAPLLLGLAACSELNRYLARAEGKPTEGSEQSTPVVHQETARETIPAPQEKPKPGRLYEWSGDGRRVSHIVVNTDEQKARFYDGDEQIGWTTVASGVSKFPTPTGQFEVMEKVANKRSNLYGKIYGAGGKVVRSDAKAGRDPIPAGARFEGAHMPYFLRLTNDGVGLHAGPIPRPGRPASHGCVRMPSKLAPVLFEHVDLGTRVSIVGTGPSYGNYVQKQRALAARERERREEAARAQAAATAVSGATADRASSQTSAPVAQYQDRSEPITTAPTETTVAPRAAQATTTAAPVPEAADPPTPATTDAKIPEPTPTAAAPVAQSAAPEPNVTPPAPAYPVPTPSLAPPPQYPGPMRPAAATVPSPVEAPIAAPDPAPSAPSAPVAPPVSAEQPPAAAEQNEG